MFNTLSNWLRKKIRRWKRSNYKTPPLPSLPAIRPSVLTPSPSALSLVQTAHQPSATAEPSFFDRFPFEIRRRILVEAFGEQVVHMHLTTEYLEMDFLRTPMSKDPLRSQHKRATITTQPNFKQNKWYWSGSVCHRVGPGMMRGVFGEKLSDCLCLGGFSDNDVNWCELWPGETVGKCSIGILGWLLSSRQAYTEGIDVLYATNTFHMARAPMILHLHQMLLPQRLAAISSVEMRWHIYPYQSETGFDEFHKLLTATLSNFPHLKKIHISIEGDFISMGSHSNEIINRIILAPIEAMIRKMVKLQRCQVDLPLSLYDQKRFKVNGEYVKAGWYFRKERIWRNLPTVHGEDETTHLSGYWISLGYMDRKIYDELQSCFGTGPSPSNSPRLSMKDLV